MQGEWKALHFRRRIYQIDYDSESFYVDDKVFRAGFVPAIDGTTGSMMVVGLKDPDLSGDFDKIMKWADQIRKLKIRANAETKPDATVAKIWCRRNGLCGQSICF